MMCGGLLRHSILAVIMLFCRPIAAQDEAVHLFREGIEAFHAGDFHGALDSFEASYALGRNPKVLFNIAMCQQSLFQYTAALETLARFVEQAELPVDDPVLLEVIGIRSELQTKVGRLTVKSSPTGLTVQLDGRPIGETPLEPARPVDPGVHTITIQKKGYAVYHREISVAGGTTLQLQAVLEQERGALEVRCPENGELVIDRTRTEPCPFFGMLPAERHHLTLKVKGAPPVHRAFVLRPDERLSINLSTPESELDSGADSPKKRRRRNPALLGIGGGALALSLGAGALGAYFAVQRGRVYDEGIRAIETQDRDRYDEIDQERLPSLDLGIAVSFVTCGVLLAAGLTFIFISRERREAPPSGRVRLGVGSVQWRF